MKHFFKLFTVAIALLSVRSARGDDDSGFPAPYDLSINHIYTHEDIPIANHPHLPMVELLTSSNTFRNPLFSWKLPVLPSTQNNNNKANLYNINVTGHHLQIFLPRMSHVSAAHDSSNPATPATPDARENTPNSDFILLYDSARDEEDSILTSSPHAVSSPRILSLLQSHLFKTLCFRVRYFSSYSSYSSYTSNTASDASFDSFVTKNVFASEWSSLGYFLPTSSRAQDWQGAVFLTADNNVNITSAPVLRTNFTLNSSASASLQSATLNAIGLGWFRAWIDGVDILQAAQPPLGQIGGWTNTEYRVPYVSLDVTSFLASGRNTHTLEVMLGEGYRNASEFAVLDNGGHRSVQDKYDRVLKALLQLNYADFDASQKLSQNVANMADIANVAQSADYVVTEGLGGWEWKNSYIAYDSVYNGEYRNYIEYARYQSTQGKQGWSYIIGDVPGPPGAMYPSVQPYVSVTQTLEPLDIYAMRDNATGATIQIVDFGVNIAGLVSINVDFNDTEYYNITIRHAEVKRHAPYGTANGDLYYDNLRSAKATDIYVFQAGTPEAPQSIMPYFTIHGFRYIAVYGYPRVLQKSDVTKYVIHANVQRRTVFNSSDAVINTIHQNCVNVLKSNMQSVVTDCPQRDERLGWMGDVGLTSSTFTLNFDMKSFFSNLLLLMRDDQYNHSNPNASLSNNDGSESFGSLPDVVPYYRYGGRPADPSWGLAFPATLHALASTYHDDNTSWVAELVDSFKLNLKLYAANLANRLPSESNGGIASYPFSYGDWVPPPPAVKVDGHFTGAWAYIETLRMMSYLAETVGDDDMAQECNETRAELVQKFIKAFVNASAPGGEDAQYLTGIQTSYVLPLESGIYGMGTNGTNVSEDALKLGLVNRVSKVDRGFVTTGILGNKYIYNILDEIEGTSGSDMSVNMIKGRDNSTGSIGNYPSYWYEANNTLEPATAVWELWDAPQEGDGMNSRAHHMYATVSKYLIENLGGMQVRCNYGGVAGCRHWVQLAGVKEETLQWGKVDMDGVRYAWSWTDSTNAGDTLEMRQFEVKLEVPLMGRVGVEMDALFAKEKFGVAAAECGNVWWILDDLNGLKWKVSSAEVSKRLEVVFDEEMIAFYGMQVVQGEINGLVLGSGRYEWKLQCYRTEN